MNAAHVHLATVHIPVLGSLIGLFILGYAMRIRSEEMRRLSLWLFVVSGLMTIVVYLSGTGAEEIVEHMQGISKQIIEPHEEMGLIALGTVLLNAILAAVGLLPRMRRTPWMNVLNLIASVVTVGVLLYTAALGGQINHPEIRPGAARVVVEEEDEKEKAPCPPGQEAKEGEAEGECTAS